MQITQTQIKTMTKAIVKLTKENNPVKHSAVLETVATSLGFKDYNALSPVLKTETPQSDFDTLTEIGIALARNISWIALAFKENSEPMHHGLHDIDELLKKAKDTYDAINGIFTETEKQGTVEEFADLEAVQNRLHNILDGRGNLETEKILEVMYFSKGWLSGKAKGSSYPDYSEIEDIAEFYDYPVETLMQHSPRFSAYIKRKKEAEKKSEQPKTVSQEDAMYPVNLVRAVGSILDAYDTKHKGKLHASEIHRIRDIIDEDPFIYMDDEDTEDDAPQHEWEIEITNEAYAEIQSLFLSIFPKEDNKGFEDHVKDLRPTRA